MTTENRDWGISNYYHLSRWGTESRFITDALNSRDNDDARATTWRPPAAPDAEDAKVHRMKLRECVFNTMAEFVRDDWHHFLYACLAIAVVYIYCSCQSNCWILLSY
ncbi:hypothetical protein EON65_51165 [archaeon]|nr:MAG: hypothetical protein EON65_51165 [archaeon]